MIEMEVSKERKGKESLPFLYTIVYSSSFQDR